MNAEPKRLIAELFQLMEDFVFYRLPGPEFADRYISTWHDYVDVEDQSDAPKKIVNIIDQVFTATDVYDSNPEIMGEHYLNEDQLREEIKGKLLSVRPELKSKLKEYVVRDGEGKKLKV